jgi:polyhydroxybutyrate depolymerase
MRHSRVVYGICLACLALSVTAGSAHAAQQQQLSIDTPSGPREYILATPETAAAGPRPLVLLLHGHLGTAANALGQGPRPSPLSGWLNIADREKLLVAALQGLKGGDNRTGWHDCRLDDPNNTSVDDVGFAGSVAASLIQSGRADPHRIYVMGMSNGGMMAYRLALQMRPAPAAIAAVSSSMAGRSACIGTPPQVSVLLINGTADPIVPYGGGPVGLSGNKAGDSTVIGAEATRDFWLRADGLAGTAPVTYAFPHLTASDPTTASRLIYGPKRGPQVEMITVQNGGHVEPSLTVHYGWLYRKLVGNQNSDFESAEAAWNFFKDKSVN